MKYGLSNLAAALIVMAFSGGAAAQIYESKDAEGNPVFTDMPTLNSEVVDLQKANIADSVEVPPAAERVAPAEPRLDSSADTADASEDDPDRVIYVGGADEDNNEREHRHGDGRPGIEPRPGVVHPVTHPAGGAGRR